MNALPICGLLFLGVFVCALVAQNYFSQKHDEAMAQAGLVQKYDTSARVVIWVKPDTTKEKP